MILDKSWKTYVYTCLRSFSDFVNLIIHFMTKISQEYVFSENCHSQEISFLNKNRHSFFPKIENFLKNLLENGAMCMPLVSTKKTWGHRAYFFRKVINIPENEEKHKKSLAKEIKLMPSKHTKISKFQKMSFFIGSLTL